MRKLLPRRDYVEHGRQSAWLTQHAQKPVKHLSSHYSYILGGQTNKLGFNQRNHMHYSLENTSDLAETPTLDSMGMVSKPLVSSVAAPDQT